MLNVITINGSKYVSLVEFYDYIFGDKPHYARWVRFYVTDHGSKMPVKGIDYLDLSDLEIRNRPDVKGRVRKDYLISLDFLKQLCFDLKTNRCRNIRQWAYSLTVR